MRAAFGLFAALFVFAATLQYNDPDPLRWIAIYLAAAAAALLAFVRLPVARPLALVVGVGALAWALTYLPAVAEHGQVGSMFDEWTMRNREVVENREMFGLFIVVIAMATVWWAGRRGANRGGARR